MHRTRSAIVASLILVLGFSSFAVARTGDPLNEGERNGTATKETEVIADIDATTGSTGGYSTRQSNKSASGGGAVYGCRSTTGGQAQNKFPCIRANNLSTGLAFEFNATGGPLGGIFTVGSGGDSKKPFTTNATGVADGLNADEVDGQSAADIVTTSRAKTGLDADTVDGLGSSQLQTRWLIVNGAGQIESQSGGFTILDAYQTNSNVYIDAGDDLTNNGITATLATQNQGSQTAAEGSRGEITASRCQIPTVVECAPANSKNVNAFVVTPRLSDGTAPAADARKRFYVQITE